MIVRLVQLPEVTEIEQKLKKSNIIFRQAIAPEKSIVMNWVRTNFSEYWANEVDVAFSNALIAFGF